MRIAVKLPIIFSALVTLIMLVLTALAWPEMRGVVRLALAAGCVIFASATAIFLGHDRNRNDLIRYGQWVFVPAVVTFIASMYLLVFFNF